MCYNTFRQYERSDGTLFPQTTLKHIVTGIIAPVDSGKTTLTEALLYKAGELKKLGRVDNGDAFLDFEELERKRGITIFSHQANLTWKNLQLTLLDTPGHVDFVSQTEQVLRVLDCAIMVVSARDLITSHARTLWNLLEFYHVPTFVFVNKLDLSELSKADIVQRLKQLDQGIVAFDGTETEELAELDDALLEKYLENDSIDRTDVLALIKQRKAFPCFFGSALKLEGIDALLQGLADFAPELESRNEFGARIFKISHTEKNERLTWLRVFGGSLHPKDMILDDQKANELRIASGNIDTAVVSDYWIGNADPNIVTWVESHDNYINDGTYNNIDSEQVVLGWAIITARKDGTPLFFDRPYNSSIDNSWGMNRIGTQGDDMYKDNRVSAVNFFRTAMKGEDENLVNPNLDSTALMIERGTKGAVIVNTNDALKVDFETNLADGTYVDRVDRKTEYTVKNGKITCDTDIPENSVVVLYNEGYTEYARPASVGVDSKTEFTYSDDTYEVTLTCSNTDNATYSLDGGKAVSYKDGDKVTIKHGDSDVSKLELRAENAEGVKTYERLEFTYM